MTTVLDLRYAWCVSTFLNSPQYVCPVSFLFVNVFLHACLPSSLVLSFPSYLSLSWIPSLYCIHPFVCLPCGCICCKIATLKKFPRMRNRLKDRDKVKSLFRRSMCKKDCGLASTLILTVAFYFTANIKLICAFVLPSNTWYTSEVTLVWVGFFIVWRL